MAQEISIPVFAEALKDGGFILDVREESEFARGHVPGALNIPLGQLPRRLAELPKDETINVICQMGSRSLKGADLLLEEGIEARSVAGGTAEWLSSGGAVE